MIKPSGLTVPQTNLIETALRQILSFKNSYEVYIFGSRARGDYRQYSDLDLWIDCSPDLTRTEEADLRFSLEDSDLPIKVDIVTPTTCLESYLKNIHLEKKLWISKSTS